MPERERREYRFCFSKFRKKTFLSSTVAAEISTWPSTKPSKYRSSKIKGDVWGDLPTQTELNVRSWPHAPGCMPAAPSSHSSL